MNTKYVIAGLAGLVSLANNAGATLAWDVNGSPDPNYGGSKQYAQEFTIGGTGITVTSLGVFGKDATFAAPITVALYSWTSGTDKISGSPLASATFNGPATASSPGSYFYTTSISSLSLAANQTYALVTYGWAGQIGDEQPLLGDLTVNMAGWTWKDNYRNVNGTAVPDSSTPWTKNSASLGGTVDGLGAGTFGYTYIPPVPEASTFAIAGVGLLSGVYFGRGWFMRRRQA